MHVKCFSLLIGLLFSSCMNNNQIVKTGDEVLITYSLTNKNNDRIDNSHLPKGDLPLKLIIGQNWFFSSIDSLLIGMEENQTISYLLTDSNAFGEQGVFYLDPPFFDTSYVIFPNENLYLNLKIEKINP